MRIARVIKRKDGLIQVEHRADGIYSDSQLPAGTKLTDVEASVLVEATELTDITDTQSQFDIVDRTLVKNPSVKSAAAIAAERRAAAVAEVLQNLADVDLIAFFCPGHRRAFSSASTDRLFARGSRRLSDWT